VHIGELLIKFMPRLNWPSDALTTSSYGHEGKQGVLRVLRGVQGYEWHTCQLVNDPSRCTAEWSVPAATHVYISTAFQ
jgi:hypothetical protein